MNKPAVSATSTTPPTADASLNEPRILYWVAINGGSAALSFLPLPLTVKCSPTPQLLIGLETLQEARRLQSLLLTAPMLIVRKEIKALRRSAEAVCLEPANPQPPTRGATIWSAN